MQRKYCFLNYQVILIFNISFKINQTSGSVYLALGTLMPMAFSKHFMAAPTAVSSWQTFKPLSRCTYIVYDVIIASTIDFFFFFLFIYDVIRIININNDRSNMNLNVHVNALQSSTYTWSYTIIIFVYFLLPKVLGLTMISMSRDLSSRILPMAGILIHRLLVLNTLNFFTDLKSSSCS